MSDPRRLHVAGGYYYVTHRCGPKQQLLATMADCQEFSDLFANLLVRYEAEAHAFFWGRKEIRVLLQISNKPLFHFMRSLTPLLAFRIARKEDSSPLFAERYSDLLLDPEEYLLRAIRDIHYRALQDPAVQMLGEYDRSSHPCYMGKVKLPWMTADTALGFFNRNKHYARLAYAEFMKTPPCEEDWETFGGMNGRRRRVLGSRLFLQRMGLTVSAQYVTTLEAVAQSVAKRMCVDLKEVCSLSCPPELLKVRAAIALEAKDCRVASFAAVARYFGLSRSTLHDLIKSHYCSDPRKRDILSEPGLTPLLSSSAVAALLARTSGHIRTTSAGKSHA